MKLTFKVGAWHHNSKMDNCPVSSFSAAPVKERSQLYVFLTIISLLICLNVFSSFLLHLLLISLYPNFPQVKL